MTHEGELAAIVESSNDAIIGKTLDGVITSWNAAAERIYGFSAGEAIGRSVTISVPPDRMDEMARILKRVGAGERVEHHKTARVRKDGRRIDVSLTVSPVHDQTGAVVGASAIARDIGSEVETENRLRLSEANYRLLFERHPVPMWVWDRETLRFVAVNESATERYGYSREEFLSMALEEISPPEDRARLHEAIADTHGQTRNGEIWRHLKKSGEIIDVAVTANRIDFEGRPARLVFALDVTEQRRIETQLRESQKLEAIGRLAGGVAHDFNNLLLVIRGYSAAVLGALTDEKLRDDVQQIENAALRAAEFTQQLLAFGRQQVLHPERIDLNQVVDETMGFVGRMLGEDITVDCVLEPQLNSVSVDRGQLGQVILNLIVNARDAMSDGGTLTVRTANVQLDEGYAERHLEVVPGAYVLVQITDTGKGMDDETRSRAFDPFFTTKDTGTGLGLATVQGIVKQSGGHVWLYSEPDLGTTFKLYFPVAGALTAPAPEAPEVGSLNGGETILLVEDAEVVRTLVVKMLRSYGYAVFEAAGGPEAVEIARQRGGEIDLLMTDVVMPGMNGRELAEALAVERPGLKVLFTSGYPADTEVRHGIEEARAVFIEKPYGPDDLARKVREALQS